MRTPFLNLSYQTQAVLGDFLRRARELADLNQFIGGDTVREFEESFARYCGSAFCVSLNSGTDGLRLALLAAGVRPGDEVITSPFTFIATTEAVSQTGKLILADVDLETFTLSPETVEQQITERTRVVLPVHIFGLPAPMMELIFLSQRNGLVVIEDACQAHGARIFGQKVGSFGQSAAFSFYPSKSLGAFGDAGAVTSSDERVDARIRSLRNHGQVGQYEHVEEGFNSRMDSLQSALLTEKLKLLDEWIEWRRRLAKIYRQELAAVEGIRFQQEPDNYRHSYSLLGALVERRSQLIEYLAGREIETRIVYPTPIHLLAAYRHLNSPSGRFANAELLCERILCFPAYPGMPEEQACDVARAIRHFYEG